MLRSNAGVSGGLRKIERLANDQMVEGLYLLSVVWLALAQNNI